MFEIGDSSVTVSNSLKKQDYLKGKYDVSIMDIRNIDVIKIRNKNRIRNGALIGGASGLIIGGITAYFLNNKDKAEGGMNLGPEFDTYMVLLTSCLTAGVGAAIGAAIGSHKTRIPVNGDHHEFDTYKCQLNGYAIKNNPKIGSVGLSAFSKIRDIMIDRDSNSYHLIALGGQVWMAEDLKVTHYWDGSEISGVTRNASGSGNQYDWFAVNDSRNLCPAGWHVPSLPDWTSLVNSLGGEVAAGSKLEDSFSKWRQIGQWWSSTPTNTDEARGFYLNSQTVGVMFSTLAKTSDLSVRCMRDN